MSSRPNFLIRALARALRPVIIAVPRQHQARALAVSKAGRDFWPDYDPPRGWFCSCGSNPKA